LPAYDLGSKGPDGNSLLCPESYLTMLADYSELRTSSLSDPVGQSAYWQTYDTRHKK